MIPKQACLHVGLAMSLGVSWVGGCGGDARVEIAAANVIDRSGDMRVRALNEYRNEIVAAASRREQNAVVALARRIRKDADNDEAVAQHVRDFTAALATLRADAQTELRRYGSSTDTVKTLREVARSMRDLAIASLSLEDETKRYLTDALTQLQQSANRAQPGQQTP